MSGLVNYASFWAWRGEGGGMYCSPCEMIIWYRVEKNVSASLTSIDADQFQGSDSLNNNVLDYLRVKTHSILEDLQPINYMIIVSSLFENIGPEV